MTATEKLYERDAYQTGFSAPVLACEPADGGWRIALGATAFYPEGGGQPYDTGVLGGAAVTAVHEQGGVIWHTADAPLPVGETVTGVIDWARRLDHMEQHTGEHILSGCLHRLYGANNSWLPPRPRPTPPCAPIHPCAAGCRTPQSLPPPTTAAKRRWRARCGWWPPAATCAPAAAPM